MSRRTKASLQAIIAEVMCNRKVELNLRLMSTSPAWHWCKTERAFKASMHESEVELNLDLMLEISWRKHIKFHAQHENELNLD